MAATPVPYNQALDGHAVWAGIVADSLSSLFCFMSQPSDDATSNAALADHDDIRGSLNGEQDAYERLVRRYQQQIGNYLWSFTRNPADHEDLVHLVFVEAYFSLSKFRGRGSFSAWLSTIATRVGYAYWKRRAKARSRNEVSLDAAPEPASQVEHENPQLARVRQALAQLAPRDRLVLTLAYLEEMSVAQVAALTGWSQSMVKVQLHRARARLKKVLAKADESG